MSYSRFGKNSDTYTYAGLKITCCSCRLALKNGEDPSEPRYLPDAHFETLDDLLMHLIQHRKAGHKVGWETFRSLLKDIIEARKNND